MRLQIAILLLLVFLIVMQFMLSMNLLQRMDDVETNLGLSCAQITGNE